MRLFFTLSVWLNNININIYIFNMIYRRLGWLQFALKASVMRRLGRDILSMSHPFKCRSYGKICFGSQRAKEKERDISIRHLQQILAERGYYLKGYNTIVIFRTHRDRGKKIERDMLDIWVKRKQTDTKIDRERGRRKRYGSTTRHDRPQREGQR